MGPWGGGRVFGVTKGKNRAAPPARYHVELSGSRFVDSLTSQGPPPREVDKGTASAKAARDAVLLHFERVPARP